MAKASYLFGYSGGRLTLAEMEQRTAWNRVHPELRRRAVALMDDCPYDLGVGNAYRSAAQQEVTFTSRYTRVSYVTNLFWDGSYWKHTSGAASAPPGRSYHEETVDGWGLAIDFLNYDPAIPWANAHAAQYGLEHLASYAGERWHFQPDEVPRSRTDYNRNPGAYPIQIGFPLPGRSSTPTPAPTPIDDGEDGMTALVGRTANGSIRFSLDGGTTSQDVRDLEHLEMIVVAGAKDCWTGNRLQALGAAKTWKQISTISDASVDARLGPAA